MDLFAEIIYPLPDRLPVERVFLEVFLRVEILLYLADHGAGVRTWFNLMDRSGGIGGDSYSVDMAISKKTNRS